MLVLQDPTDAESSYLLESLLESFRAAKRVAGAFAFASSTGIRLLADDPLFRQVASDYSVDLVVGVDAVTNGPALDTLSQIAEACRGLNARAFLNRRHGSCFHPKFCWSKTAHGGWLICGSGNLTEAGLLGNWEAYSVAQLGAEEIAAVESTWNQWTARHEGSLLPLDNPEVRRLAEQNHVQAIEGDLPTLVAGEQAKPDSERLALGEMSSAPVLLAEVPRSGDRWNQVNFRLADYRGFFGVVEGRGSDLLMVFRHVQHDGTMADYERSRPPVTVRSRNFRFELAAARGLSYPESDRGRPIGAYIRVATRTFLYSLLLPGDSQYATVVGILRSRAGASGRGMRSAQMTVRDLRDEWPGSPFWIASKCLMGDRQ